MPKNYKWGVFVRDPDGEVHVAPCFPEEVEPRDDDRCLWPGHVLDRACFCHPDVQDKPPMVIYNWID